MTTEILPKLGIEAEEDAERAEFADWKGASARALQEI
jgi:hypothetical protein